jgi:hypothetical protein
VNAAAAAHDLGGSKPIQFEAFVTNTVEKVDLGTDDM